MACRWPAASGWARASLRSIGRLCADGRTGERGHRRTAQRGSISSVLTFASAGVHPFTMRDIDERGLARGDPAKPFRRRDEAPPAFICPSTWTPSIRRKPRAWARRCAADITYREAHLAMEIIGDSGRMTSLEIVEVNPVLDVANRTAMLGVELIMSALGKEFFMQTSTSRCCTAAAAGSTRSRCARPSRSSPPWIPSKYEVQRIFITPEGRWEPESDSAGARRESRHRCRVPGAAWHVRRRRHRAGSAGAGRSPVCGRGRARSAVAMDKEVTKRLLQRARPARGGIRRASRGAYRCTVRKPFRFRCSSSRRI